MSLRPFVPFRSVLFRSVVLRRQTSTLSLMPLPLTRVTFAITVSSSLLVTVVSSSSFPSTRSIQPPTRSPFPPSSFHQKSISFLSLFLFFSFFFSFLISTTRERTAEHHQVSVETSFVTQRTRRLVRRRFVLQSVSSFVEKSPCIDVHTYVSRFNPWDERSRRNGCTRSSWIFGVFTATNHLVTPRLGAISKRKM